MLPRKNFSLPSGIGAFLLLFIVLGWSYRSLLFSCFGFSDDYGYLATDHASRTLLIQTADGRPGFAYVTWLISSLDSICDIRWIRALSVFGSALLGTALFLVFRNDRVLGGVALLFAFCLTLSPPFGVFSSWAAMFPYPFSFSLALLSGAAVAGGGGIGALSFSLLALFLSLTIYQPAACYFWIGATPWLLGTAKPPSASLRKALGCLVFFTLGVGLYYLLYQLSVWPFTEPPSVRGSGLVSDIFQRLYQLSIWLFTDALNPFSLNHSLYLSLLMLALIVSGIALDLKRERKHRSYLLLVYLSLIPLSCFPNVLSSGLSVNFRTASAVYALSIFLALRGGMELWRLLRVQGLPFGKPILLSLAVVLLSQNSHQQVLNGFVRPQETELEIVRLAVKERFQSCPSNVSVVRPGFSNVLSPLRYDEFGQPSSLPPWGPNSLLPLLLDEIFGDCRDVQIHSVGAGEESEKEVDIDLPTYFERAKKQRNLRVEPPRLLYNALNSSN